MMRPRVLLLTAVVVSLASCTGTDTSLAGCTTVNESQANDSSVHVIASALVEYASLPPTSGPHAPGPEAGFYDRQLSFPEQVGVLERGDAVVQYQPSTVTVDQVARLNSYANDAVLFPNSDQDESIVATAWRVRMTCSTPNIGAVTYFLDEHVGQGAPPKPAS